MTDLVDQTNTVSPAPAVTGAPLAGAIRATDVATGSDPRDRAFAVVGVVDGSTQTSTQSFQIVLADDAVVQLDDLLAVTRSLPDGTDVTHYGIVVEIRGTIEEATTPSYTSDVRAGTSPGRTSRVAEVRILRNDPETWVPPDPGTEVRALAGSDRERALFRDQMAQALAVGLDRTNRPVWADWEFINGSRGGHVRISGISGVATKTSYAVFLLYMLIESGEGQRLLGATAPNTRALVFNVKSEDLLFLDRPNRNFAGDDDAREKWAAVGVSDPQPFARSRIHLYAPRRPSYGGANDPDTVRTDGAVLAYGWTPYAFITEGLLDFCFTDADDRRGGNQISFVIQRVRAMLQRHVFPSASPGGAAVIVPQLADQAPRDPGQRAPIGREHGTEIRSFSELVDFLEIVLNPDHGDPAWQAGVQPNTLAAVLRRLYACLPRLGHLVACGVRPVDIERGGISVVDIHSLHDTAQRFVVGALLHRIFEAKQGRGRLPLQFIVLDELNRYAPRDGSSPIKDVLVDIAQRGRSMGVLLIGCSQSAGDVDGHLNRNAALKVVGRLDAADTADYGFLSNELRQRATRILPGAMIVNQPVIPESLLVHYPFPPYATCHDEADMTPDVDQRARLDSIFEGG